MIIGRTPPASGLRRLTVAGLFVLVCASCSPADGGSEGGLPPGADSETALPARDIDTIPTPAILFGGWSIVQHIQPGVAATDSATAARRVGEVVRVSTASMSVAGDVCREPAYRVRSEEVAGFLARWYGLTPDAIALLETPGRVPVVDVDCSSTWPHVGATWLVVDSARALSPHDGVFYVLERVRDLHASGLDPDWTLEILQGDRMRLSRPGLPDVYTPVPVPSAAGAEVSYHAVTEANDLRVEVEAGACATDATPPGDERAPTPWDGTVRVVLNGTALEGCGRWSP